MVLFKNGGSGNNNNPWGGGSNQNNNPDFDEIMNSLRKRFGKFYPLGLVEIDLYFS